MAQWSALRKLLTGVDDRLTVQWSDLDRMVGGLPRSAYVHSAFWTGDRSGWPDFTTTNVRVGEQVTFVRRHDRAGGISRTKSEPGRPKLESDAVDVVLVGCVKSKLDRPSPARDLYTSTLFRKERAYAETTGLPWFILSAEYGLVEPTQVIEPYELHLASTSRTYRHAWGTKVIVQLEAALGDLAGKTIEIHAGAAYVDAIRSGLEATGVTLVLPLAGLSIGGRLAWYSQSQRLAEPIAPEADTDEVAILASRLRDGASAITPAEFLAHGKAGLDGPGLYSWWVDESGAAELSLGLGYSVAAGLIYAGLAGATRSRSGRRSTNTLWGRLKGMHLGSKNEFSTFRRTLGSILAEVRGTHEIDEVHLTAWMHDHLRLLAIPVVDADRLDWIETGVLAALDPPLNLAKMPETTVRLRLTDLRRLHAKSRSRVS